MAKVVLRTLVLAVCLWSGVVAADAAASTGALAQKPGMAGCISQTGAPCAEGQGLAVGVSVTVSPDGTSAYVASEVSDTVVVLDRAADGTLTQKPGAAGCISETGASACGDGKALVRARSVTVSPDGRSVYVAAYDGDAVAVFDRAVDGTLTQKAGATGCISETPAGPCGDGMALDGAVSITASADGASVYVAPELIPGVAVFDRAVDGALTQKAGTAGCISDSGSSGLCVDGAALFGAFSVTVSPDGTSAYVASWASDAVAVFDRAGDGALTQKAGTAGCISDTGAGPCADGTALASPRSVTVSPDDRSVYVASIISGAVAVFDRAADGTLNQKPGSAGCISDSAFEPCVDGTALNGAFAVTVSPDGTSVYVMAALSYAVAVFDREAIAPAATTPPPPAPPPPPPPPATLPPLPAPVPPPSPPAPPVMAQPGCRLAGNVIVASSGNDVRAGTRAADIVFGLAGNDVLRGASGDDCLYGQSGADRLLGGPGADRLFGGDGADRLSDKRGRDVFSGGAGNDEIDARDDSRAGRQRSDDVRCGAGKRDVARVDRRDRVARDCERVRRR